MHCKLNMSELMSEDAEHAPEHYQIDEHIVKLSFTEERKMITCRVKQRKVLLPFTQHATLINVLAVTNSNRRNYLLLRPRSPPRQWNRAINRALLLSPDLLVVRRPYLGRRR